MILTGLSFMMIWLSGPFPPSSSLLKVQDPPASAMTLELMKIAFPEAKQGKCLAELPGGNANKYQLEALDCVAIGTDWMVLVANAVGVDENNQPDYSHVNAGLLNLIWFKKVKGDWRRAGHEMNVDAVGSSGQLGKIGFHPLPAGRMALAIEPHYSNHGQTYRWLVLYELIPEKSRSLAKQIGLYHDNLHACSAEECIRTEGKWSFAQAPSSAVYPDLIIKIDGTASSFTSESSQDNTPCCDEPGWKVTKQINERAVYAYSQGEYRLKEGKNPVVEF